MTVRELSYQGRKDAYMKASDLRAIRARHDINQVPFAKMLGIHPKTLQGWERGHINIPEWGANLIRYIDADLSSRTQ